MRFTVYYKNFDGENKSTTTDASGSREAIKKVRKKLPSVDVVRAEKVI